jgi:hypothetical protein
MLSAAHRASLRASGRISRLAMAKVEGSNPFIRFEQKPCKLQGFLLSRRRKIGPWRVWVTLLGNKRGAASARFRRRVRPERPARMRFVTEA